MNLFNFKQDYFRIHLVLIKDGSLIPDLDQRYGNIYYKWFRKSFLDFSVLKKLHNLINKEGIKIVHTHQFIELLYAFFLKLLHPRLKIVHQIHTMYETKDWAFYLERYLSYLFTNTYTVSEAAKQELIYNFGFKHQNISVLHNAVKINDLNGDQNHKEILGIDRTRINIVMIANFVWGKDHETIFKAYDLYIRDQIPEVSFYFIGKKSNISERLIAEYLNEYDILNKRIVLLGAIPNAKDLLPAFDIVVMSCFSETFNMALVEAASYGKAILASDIPVFLELSEEGKYFRHFKTGNPLSFYSSLSEMIRDQQLLAVHDYATYYRNKFGYPLFVEKLNDIYQNYN
ncbi:MAG: glycosyltransferase family 4 protein [Saprospiraceae bacterium]|nr:glycosyltransferase family 4 protein [Saprospiraceae bacterium]